LHQIALLQANTSGSAKCFVKRSNQIARSRSCLLTNKTTGLCAASTWHRHAKIEQATHFWRCLCQRAWNIWRLNWRATLLKLTEARGNARSRRRNAKSLGNAIDWPLADCLTRQAAQRSAHNRSTRAKPKAESSASATALQCSLRASLWRFTSAEAAYKSLKAT
jgi:hypothetical protein